MFLSNVFKVLATAFLGTMLFSCSAEDEAFQAAQIEDSIEAYEKYVADYPDNQNAVTVDNRLESLYYLKAKKDSTDENFQAYLGHFPQGRHAGEVRSMAEKSMYQVASKSNSVDGWSLFIKSFPNGNYTRKATLRRDELAYFSKITFQDSSVAEVNLAGERRGPKDGFEVAGNVVNSGDRTLKELTVDVAPKGQKAGVEVKVEIEEGLAPGAEAPFLAQFSDVPEGWDGSTLRMRASHVAFAKK